MPLLHYTDLLSRYTLCNVHNWASCTAMTTSPHSRTPTRPQLHFWKSHLMVRLSEIFYARERGQWHRRHSAPCTSKGAPPPKCTPTPTGAPMGDLFVALTRHSSAFLSSLFRRETKEKEEGNEMKRSASARDEGSTNGERITRASTRPQSVSRRRS